MGPSPATLPPSGAAVQSLEMGRFRGAFGSLFLFPSEVSLDARKRQEKGNIREAHDQLELELCHTFR